MTTATKLPTLSRIFVETFEVNLKKGLVELSAARAKLAAARQMLQEADGEVAAAEDKLRNLQVTLADTVATANRS